MKRKSIRILIVSLIVAMLLIPFFGVSQVFAAETMYENLNTGGDADSSDIYGINMTAMQFTSQSTAHTVTKIKVFLKRTGSPGTVFCTLRTAAAGIPTGEDLAYATFSGNSLPTTYGLITFTLIDEYSLLASTQYAIVLSASSGDAANYVSWWLDTDDGDPTGNASYTTDGVTWTDYDAGHATDALFEIWGNTVLDVVVAKAFQDYISNGDLLITAEVINSYPPYNTTENVQDYFQIQFLNPAGTTILAAVPCTAWGYKPQSVYLSPTAAGSVTIGGAYQVRVIGTFASPPSDTYTLTSADWMGDDLSKLDSWILNYANKIQTYYSWTGTSALVQYVTDSGEQLTDSGGAIFTNAIPGIGTIRPGIFSIIKSKPLMPSMTANPVYDSQDYRTIIGTPIANDFDTFGNVFGITGKNFAGIMIGVGIVVVVLIGVILGGGMAALPIFVVGGLPLLFIGNYMRVIGLQWTLVLAVVMFVLFTRQFWWKST